MKPTPRESTAALRLAEAILEFVIATEEGRQGRQPREEVAVRVEHVQPPPPPAPPQAPAATTSSEEGSGRLLMTAKEACKYLSIGERLLWSMSAPRGPLPVVKLRKAIRYPVAELDAAILKMKLKPRKDPLS